MSADQGALRSHGFILNVRPRPGVTLAEERQFFKGLQRVLRMAGLSHSVAFCRRQLVSESVPSPMGLPSFTWTWRRAFVLLWVLTQPEVQAANVSVIFDVLGCPPLWDPWDARDPQNWFLARTDAAHAAFNDVVRRHCPLEQVLQGLPRLQELS